MGHGDGSNVPKWDTGDRSGNRKADMKSIAEIQKEIIEEFNACGDSFDQYGHLITKAKELLPFTQEARKIASIVQGCQSQVWVSTQCKDGIFEFSGISQSAIINGMIALLERIFCGQPCEDVANAEITFIEETQFFDTFESERAKGIRYLIRMLQETAKEGCPHESNS